MILAEALPKRRRSTARRMARSGTAEPIERAGRVKAMSGVIHVCMAPDGSGRSGDREVAGRVRDAAGSSATGIPRRWCAIRVGEAGGSRSRWPRPDLIRSFTVARYRVAPACRTLADRHGIRSRSSAHRAGSSRWRANKGVEAIIPDERGLLLIPESGQSILRVTGARARELPIGDAGGRISDVNGNRAWPIYRRRAAPDAVRVRKFAGPASPGRRRRYRFREARSLCR